MHMRKACVSKHAQKRGKDQSKREREKGGKREEEREKEREVHPLVLHLHSIPSCSTDSKP